MLRICSNLERASSSVTLTVAKVGCRFCPINLQIQSEDTSAVVDEEWDLKRPVKPHSRNQAAADADDHLVLTIARIPRRSQYVTILTAIGISRRMCDACSLFSMGTKYEGRSNDVER